MKRRGVDTQMLSIHGILLDWEVLVSVTLNLLRLKTDVYDLQCGISRSTWQKRM